MYQGVKSSGIARAVNREITSDRPDYIINSRIQRFEQFIGNDKILIEVALDVSVKAGSANLQGWNKLYEASITLNDMDMHASAQAFGDALQKITEQLMSDILAKK